MSTAKAEEVAEGAVWGRTVAEESALERGGAGDGADAGTDAIGAAADAGSGEAAST